MNHLTAARVYRKLAELGYVSASVGRGTFVRALTPASSASHGDDWQVYALPPDELTYSEQVLADTFSLAGREDVISLADRLARAEHLSDGRGGAYRRGGVRGGGRQRVVLPARRGIVRAARADRGARPHVRLCRGRR